MLDSYAVYMNDPLPSVSILYPRLRKYPPTDQSGAGSAIPACWRTFAKEIAMLDVILLIVGLGFFALSILYAFGCERL